MGVITLLGILCIFHGFCQPSITGSWNGLLRVQGSELRLVINIEQTENGLTATMDSPDQGAKGLPISKISFADSLLSFEVSNLQVKYLGKKLSSTLIEGTFTQSGYPFPLNLSSEQAVKSAKARAQDPVEPYQYKAQEVTFANQQGGHTLSGTLTIPSKGDKFPAVVLISGSGAQDRNEEIMGHRPFLVIADYLTRNGIAVLRYDDRGVGKSTGDYTEATTADLSTDAMAAVSLLKTIPAVDSDRIGLAGHSEGGIIASMVASQSGDIAYIISLAGSGVGGDSILMLQTQALGEASGMDKDQLCKVAGVNRKIYDAVKITDNDIALTVILTSILSEQMAEIIAMQPQYKEQTEKAIKGQVNAMTSPWMKYFIRYNPQTALEKTKCPVLALNGEKDLQVPAKGNLEAIKTSLERGGNKNVTTHLLPNLNHLFQECTSGLPNEYASIEQTISPTVLEIMAQWIKKLF